MSWCYRMAIIEPSRFALPRENMTNDKSHIADSSLKLPLHKRLLFGFVAFLCCVGIAEVCFRIIGYDFNQTSARLEAIPPFYRIPTEPFAKYFFKRPANTSWNGQVIRSQMDVLGIDSSDYQDEATVALNYDSDGFRNPSALDDWEIVVVGDSFTELGNLSDDQLFTSILASTVGKRVKNLGASYTGTRTQIQYLSSFGKSDTTRIAVLAFFEGNDIEETVSEVYRKVNIDLGELSLNDFFGDNLIQTSLVGFILDRITDSPVEKIAITRDNAAVQLPNGDTARVGINYMPLNEIQLGEAGVMMQTAISDWAKMCQSQGLEPWLVYLPCKHRVLHPLGLRFDVDVNPLLKAWMPSDLPQWVNRECQKNNVTFIDTTSALIDSARDGEIPFNLIYDTHLNARGSAIVAAELADVLVQ